MYNEYILSKIHTVLYTWRPHICQSEASSVVDLQQGLRRGYISIVKSGEG